MMTTDLHNYLQDLDEQHDRARVLVPGQSGVPQRSLDPECLHLQPQEFSEHRRPQATRRSVLYWILRSEKFL